MRKTYKYRLCPTSKQSGKLLATLVHCRDLYNKLLQERIDSWNIQKKFLSMHQQQKTITIIKQDDPILKEVHSQVLQNVATRLDLAFQAFFRRVKQQASRPGYPRFKGLNRYTSFTYPQPNTGSIKVKNNTIYLSKIGDIKVDIHRKLMGTIATCTISKSPSGKWFACLSCDDIPERRLRKSSKQVGIDCGLKTFATMSDGTMIDNPRFFKHDKKDLARAQRKLERLKKIKANPAPARKVISRIHERTANRRRNFAHQHSRKIVNHYGTICVEDLSINTMKGFSPINRSIHDAAWRQFLDFISYKAEEAGRKFVKVNPAYTSQDCSNCHYRQCLPLEQRTYSCPNCGTVIDRDLNAAKNILRLGLQSLSHKPMAIKVPALAGN